MINLYNHIEQLAKKQGYKNITELCRAANVSRATMTELKKGRSKDISKPNAQKIAKVLNITLDEVYGITDENKETREVLYDRISELCKERGITGYRLCKDVGIQPSLLTDLKMGRQSGLSAANTNKIANYFGVSVGYLLGTEKTPDESDVTFDDFTYAFYNESKELSEEKKQQLLEMAKFFKQQQDKEKGSNDR